MDFFHSFWFQALSFIVVATFHGYGAAWLAVRMLFRPRQPFKVFGVTVFPQGMIPRHRERLAEAIGKAVGNELMSHETIINALFKDNFLPLKVEKIVNSFADNLLSKEYPSLVEALPTKMRPFFVESATSLQKGLGEFVAKNLRSEETVRTIENFVGRRVDELLEKRFSSVVPDEKLLQTVGFIENRLRETLQQKDLQTKIRGFISQRADELTNTELPLGSMFTAETIEFVKDRFRAQIQPIVHHLAEIATQERTRSQIGTLVKHEISDYYQELPFYQKMFVSREKLFTEVDDLINTTLPRRVEEVLRGDAFAREAENFLSVTIDNFLARPVSEILRQIAPERLEKLKTQLVNSIFNVLQSEQVQTHVSAYLTDSLYKLRPHRLKAILERVSPDAAPKLKNLLTKSITSFLAKDETTNVVNSIISEQIERLLITPVGKISAFVPEQTVRQISAGVSESISTAARQKLPEAIAEFDVGKIVRERVNSFPVEKLEDLILSIAKEHLRTIELFGGVIGFLLGILQALQVWYFSHR